MTDAAPPPQATPEAIAAEYLRRNVSLDIGACVKRGWNLVMQNPGPLIGSSLLVVLVFACLSFIPILGWLASIALNGPLGGGLYYMFIRRIRGETIAVGDVFSGLSQNFVGLFLAAFVSSLLVFVGFLLCLLPGIYLAASYIFILPLVIDKKLEFWPAMEVSRRVVQPQWFTIFGLLIVNFLIGVAGTLACLVGLVVAIPVVVASIAYAYEDLFGKPAA